METQAAAAMEETQESVTPSEQAAADETGEQTNEEIARLALKEASELIDKAKKNANMILSESLEYVRSLSGEMSDFKAQAVRFRASVEKMSKDILESIDKSEVYNLMNEESKNEKYDEGDSL